MSTPILICAGITALLLIIILAVITYCLGVIAEYMINIHADLMWFRAKIELRELERLMHETRNICRMPALSPKEKQAAYKLLIKE